jgi:hypothetical protein
MGEAGTSIRWNPRVRQEQIWQIYQNDARGLVDAELLDAVGFTLYQRCQSILMVEERKVECPRCWHIFPTGWQWHKRCEAMPIHCPSCREWQITGRQYRESFCGDNLAAGNALPAFQEFVEVYPHATTPRERMLLIDRLIHEFHYRLTRTAPNEERFHRSDSPHASTGCNLIEGHHDEVVAFLDRLTYGPGSTPELRVTYSRWNQQASAMISFRSRRKRREGE